MITTQHCLLYRTERRECSQVWNKITFELQDPETTALVCYRYMTQAREDVGVGYFSIAVR
jgi:hypothetical protein